MKKSHLLLLLFSLGVSGLFAQKAPIKFGKVDPEAVAETHFAADSTVDAAVLCEYGVFSGTEFKFSATTRYKVYTKEGLNSLIMSIPVQFKSQVRGIVYNMVDGKVVESKLRSEHIYSERVIGQYTRMRIAPPDAREGSVIDIRYTMSGLPREWNFQKRIPVVHSELIIPYSEYFSFNKRFIGYVPLTEVKSHRWVAKDMPAFIPEPYIASSSNYMTTMFIELSEVHVSGGGTSMGVHEQFSTSWEAVSDLYYDSQKYGTISRSGASYLNDAAEEVRAQSSTDQELVANALARIHADVKWDKSNRLYPTTPLREVYVKDKTGNSTDMNFLFMKLLNKLDMECYPVLMSTRSDGFINPHFPTQSRFTYTASYVKVGDKFHVIDASDKYYSWDMLSKKCLNTGGFVLKKEGSEWVDIVPEKLSGRIINCNLNITEDGMLEGSVTRQLADYAAAAYRKSREDYTTEDEFLEEFEKDNPGLFVMDYSVENLDKDLGAIKEEFEVEIDGRANISGGMIHLSPILMEGVEENPFKLEKREYPVDFAYGRNDMYILNLTIPEGYVAQQLPEPVRIVNSDKSASFMYSVAQSGNRIQLMYRLGIKKPLFLMEEYNELRSLFDIVVNKEAEPIILKRAEP